MDNFSLGCEKGFRLGTVARTLSGETDLFAVLSDPLTFTRHMRLPSGPAILLPGAPTFPEVEEAMDLERWDGLS